MKVWRNKWVLALQVALLVWAWLWYYRPAVRGPAVHMFLLIAQAPITVPVQLQATGTQPITWSLAGGALPPGLTLQSSGIISGTPTTAGTFTFTAKATNAGGSAAKIFSITVTAACTINTTSPLTSATAGASYTPVTLSQTGCAGSWFSSGVPAGMTLSSVGVLSGTPTTPGVSSVQVWVGSATKTLSLMVSPAGPPSSLNGSAKLSGSVTVK